MKAICHVGLPKTGSTSLQQYLAQNKTALAADHIGYERFGERLINQPEYLYLGLDRLGQTRGSDDFRWFHGISDRAALAQRAHTVRDWLKQKLSTSDAKTWIISSELLTVFFNTVDDIATLNAVLREFFDEVDYVIYVRRQDHWLVSEYSERLRNGLVDTLDQFLADVPPTDLSALVDMWVRTVGRSRVTVRAYGATSDFDLITDFFTAMNLTLPSPVKPVANRALTQSGAQLLQRGNQVLMRLNLKSKMARLWTRRALKLTAAKIGGAPITCSADQREQILSQVRASNHRMCHRYMPEHKDYFVGLEVGASDAMIRAA